MEYDEDVYERFHRPRSPFKPDSKWFIDSNSLSKNEREALQCLSQKASHQYSSKDYASASESYEKCLKFLPASNTACRQECMENLSRSLLHMDCPEQALVWALKMDAIASNTEEKFNSLSLLASVCHVLGKHEEELEALHSCLETQKCNPHLWFKIAICYGGLFKIPLPNSKLVMSPVCCPFKSRLSRRRDSKKECHPNTLEGSDNSNAAQSEANKDPSSAERCTTDCPEEDDLWCGRPTLNLPSELFENHDADFNIIRSDGKCGICTLGVHMISTCLLNARVHLGDSEESPFALERRRWMDQKIDDCLTSMEVEQVFIDEVLKMLPLSKEIPLPN